MSLQIYTGLYKNCIMQRTYALGGLLTQLPQLVEAVHLPKRMSWLFSSRF